MWAPPCSCLGQPRASSLCHPLCTIGPWQIPHLLNLLSFVNASTPKGSSSKRTRTRGKRGPKAGHEAARHERGTPVAAIPGRTSEQVCRSDSKSHSAQFHLLYSQSRRQLFLDTSPPPCQPSDIIGQWLPPSFKW